MTSKCGPAASTRNTRPPLRTSSEARRRASAAATLSRARLFQRSVFPVCRLASDEKPDRDDEEDQADRPVGRWVGGDQKPREAEQDHDRDRRTGSVAECPAAIIAVMKPMVPISPPMDRRRPTVFSRAPALAT